MEKPFEDFSPGNNVCRPCRNDYRRRRYRYLREAGFEPKEACNGGVDLGECANPGCVLAAAHTDHDHKTGRFRGALCQLCNITLRDARDDIVRLAGLVEYLRAPDDLDS